MFSGLGAVEGNFEHHAVVRVVDAVVPALDPVLHGEDAVVGIVALVEADMPLAHDDFRLVQAIAGLAAARPLRPPLAAIGAGLAHVVELAAKLEQRAGFGEAKGAAARGRRGRPRTRRAKSVHGGGGRARRRVRGGGARCAVAGGEGGGDGIGRELAGLDAVIRPAAVLRMSRGRRGGAETAHDRVTDLGWLKRGLKEG